MKSSVTLSLVNHSEQSFQIAFFANRLFQNRYFDFRKYFFKLLNVRLGKFPAKTRLWKTRKKFPKTAGFKRVRVRIIPITKCLNTRFPFRLFRLKLRFEKKLNVLLTCILRLGLGKTRFSKISFSFARL